jgi:hypothetical protein
VAYAPIQHVQPYITNKLDMTTIPSSYAANWPLLCESSKTFHHSLRLFYIYALYWHLSFVFTDFGELWRAVNKIKIDIVAKTEVILFENEGVDTNLADVYTSSEGELFFAACCVNHPKLSIIP